MTSRTVTIINRLGLHARAATRLVNCSSQFESEILIRKGARTINGKSIMGVLTLAASPGTELQIEANGHDEEEAIESLLRLINNRFGEGE